MLLTMRRDKREYDSLVTNQRPDIPILLRDGSAAEASALYGQNSLCEVFFCPEKMMYPHLPGQCQGGCKAEDLLILK